MQTEAGAALAAPAQLSERCLGGTYGIVQPG